MVSVDAEARGWVVSRISPKVLAILLASAALGATIAVVSHMGTIGFFPRALIGAFTGTRIALLFWPRNAVRFKVMRAVGLFLAFSVSALLLESLSAEPKISTLVQAVVIPAIMAWLLWRAT